MNGIKLCFEIKPQGYVSNLPLFYEMRQLLFMNAFRFNYLFPDKLFYSSKSNKLGLLPLCLFSLKRDVKPKIRSFQSLDKKCKLTKDNFNEKCGRSDDCLYSRLSSTIARIGTLHSSWM